MEFRGRMMTTSYLLCSRTMIKRTRLTRPRSFSARMDAVGCASVRRVSDVRYSQSIVSHCASAALAQSFPIFKYVPLVLASLMIMHAASILSCPDGTVPMLLRQCSCRAMAP
jgi:hypothetical protein